MCLLVPLAKGHQGYCLGGMSALGVSINIFLVSKRETTIHKLSGLKLQEVFMGTRSQMSALMSKICPVTPELLALKD